MLQQPPGGGLAHGQQVAEVAPRPAGAGRARAAASIGPSSRGVDGVAQVEPPGRGPQRAVPGRPGGGHAVELVDARGRPPRACPPGPPPPSGSGAGRPGAGARWRPAPRASRAGAPPPTGRRCRSRRSRGRRCARALSTRRPASVPPWTMPNSACPSGRASTRSWWARARAAHAAVRSTATRRTSAVAGSEAHTSSTIWMSAPSSPWTSTADSGVRRVARAVVDRGEGHPVVVDLRAAASGPGTRRSRSGCARPSR